MNQSHTTAWVRPIRRKHLFRGFAIAWLAILGANTALAGAKQDCKNLKGDAAIRACTQAIRQNSRDAQSYIRRGIAYGLNENFDRAISDYNKAMAIIPKSPWPYNLRGLAYSAKGEHRRAIADFDRAIALDPKSTLSYLNRCEVYAATGDNDRAVADCSKAIQLDPKSADTYYSRGEAFFAKGQYTQAIGDFDTAIGLSPKYAAAYNSRCNAYRIKGDEKRAASDCSKAVALDPKYAARQAELLSKQKAIAQSMRQSVDDYHKRGAPLTEVDYPHIAIPKAVLSSARTLEKRHGSAVIKPEHVKGCFADYFGEYVTDTAKWDNCGRIAEYISSFKVPDDQFKNYHELWTWMASSYRLTTDDIGYLAEFPPGFFLGGLKFEAGRAAFNLHQYEFAADLFTRALNESPDFARARVARAEAFMEAGQLSRALEDLDLVARQLPQAVNPLILRARVNLRMGHPDIALSDANEAIRIAPKSADAYGMRASVHVKRNDAKHALADYTKAIELDPEMDIYYLLRSAVYEAIGDKRRAAADKKKYDEAEAKEAQELEELEEFFNKHKTK